jgi:ABC-type multidrug transport system fused ATPase/permease subunit
MASMQGRVRPAHVAKLHMLAGPLATIKMKIRMLKLKGANKLLTNNWVITLTATLVGVFLALYLNDWSNNRTLREDSRLAKSIILDELKHNASNLQESMESHQRLRDIFIFLGSNYRKDEGLISTPNIINEFQKKYPQILSVSDSIRLDENSFKYEGEINLDLSFPQVNLKTIAWETFKDTRISTLYDFNCLMYLETIYSIIQEIKDNNKLLFDYLRGEKPQGDNYENVIKNLTLLIDFEKVAIEALIDREENLKNCG